MKNNTIIIGDSYSTFKGYIPEGYEVYYSEEENSETDVRKVEETWWFQVFKEKNFNLMLNNSWSGSTIGYTGYDNKDCSGSSSFIYRFRKLIESGFFVENEIDTMFIFGGTNDSWCKAPLGEMKYSDWEEKDFYFVLPAMCYFFNLVKETLPEAKVYCLINCDIKPEIISCLKELSDKHGFTSIAFENVDKRCGHTTIKGMNDLKNQVLSVLNQ